MNSLAEELNSVLDGTVAGRLMSPLGRRMYFPRGIIAQSQEAKQKATVANATLGMAYSRGKPLLMPAISDNLPGLAPEETVVYAPTAGVEKVREAWKELILQKNPSIRAEHLSLPVVVPGITAGISITADLFLGEGENIVTSSPCWDNYGLIFRDRRGAEMTEIPFFGVEERHGGTASGGGLSSFGGLPSFGGLDLEGMEKALRGAAAGGSLRVILNFPNNPSGYSPTRAEEDALVAMLKDIAEGGTDVLVFCDDAYFGLFYENDIIQESIFGRLVNLHERILAVKIDGPTKEDYAWGFRMAFVALGSKGLDERHWDALIKKYMGFIRSSVSCSNTPAQYLMLKTMEDPRTPGEKERFFGLLKGRYLAVKRFLASRPPHPALAPLPFNSGYFMSFRCNGISAEGLRRALLERGIGAIALEDRWLRVTFAAIEEEDIETVYTEIYAAASALSA